MNEKEKLKLKQFAFELIEEEGLPKPKEIRFRSPLYGARKTYGRIYKSKLNGDFVKIIVSLTKERFVEDDDGKYIDKATGQYYRRAYGVPMDKDTIVRNMAHEISHLKFWRHDTAHHTYTNYLFKKLKQKIRGRGK